ncbi:hypothetical protein I5P84_13565 [Pseudomonas mosselii]|uniref:hypothetical protein n=1 Tax=Pseudomonas mosselii TaxID=78327 RepID=UPI0018D6BD85|nr:hypothetical protein [Pseudomonas mosselii]MBH3310463.1 hypothetical protein [Pseudomonas mosselii]MBH3325958.1 hypothetical protein [Pseudomonas mosselii]
MTIKISQIYHPVGHGTFHTGTAWGKKHGMFRWAYDCGSKRKKYLSATITTLAKHSYKWGFDAAVDILVISHFDDDHVNGVEQFLRTWRVKWLALPYINLPQKLENASDHGGASCSDSTALFQLDPERWLISRGLEGRVEKVLQVKGGPQEKTDESQNPFPEGPIDRPDQHDTPEVETAEIQLPYGSWHGVSELDQFAKPENNSLVTNTKSNSFYTLNHHQSFKALNSNIEFIFYNSDEPSLCTRSEAGSVVAKRSGVDLNLVSDEVNKVISDYNIGLPGVESRSGWRKKLRYVYDHHFGKSSKKRNNISLCLYTRPIADTPITIDTNTGEFIFRNANLSLGDLTISPHTIKSLKMHLGDERWSALSTVQIPHHGSRHSWHPGAANFFDAPYFIHCVPDSSPHHPHPEVTADLETEASDTEKEPARFTLKANYVIGVKSHIEISDIYSPSPGSIELYVGPWFYLLCE